MISYSSSGVADSASCLELEEEETAAGASGAAHIKTTIRYNDDEGHQSLSCHVITEGQHTLATNDGHQTPVLIVSCKPPHQQHHDIRFKQSPE